MAVPFFCYVADLVSPEQPGIMLVTSLVEIVPLNVVFQFTRILGQRSVNWVMVLFLIV